MLVHKIHKQVQIHLHKRMSLYLDHRFFYMGIFRKLPQFWSIHLHKHTLQGYKLRFLYKYYNNFEKLRYKLYRMGIVGICCLLHKILIYNNTCHPYSCYLFHIKVCNFGMWSYNRIQQGIGHNLHLFCRNFHYKHMFHFRIFRFLYRLQRIIFSH